MRWADHPAVTWALAGLAFALAAAWALPFAGGYNDGSRLATAESLIDRGTLAIDDSVYVRPGPEIAERGILPYAPYHDIANRDGTLDKVLVKGHFYSDKPMIPAILTAGVYRVLMLVGLPRPGERPDVFCRVATILTCGLTYALAVGCMWILGRRAGLPPLLRFLWLMSFALAGVLPAYTRQVNSGMPQLAAVAALAVLLSRIATATGAKTPWFALVTAGFCAGFGYTLDQGSGPPLLAFATAAVAVRTRRFAPVGVFVLGALPWVAAHHIINFAVGGVWVPLGMVPEYLEWPGSDYDRTNMTGLFHHTPMSFLLYNRELLFDPTGFLVSNPPLFLAVAVGWMLFRRSGRDSIEVAALLGWCVAVYGVYALLSSNGGGGCLSVRWFVPLLVPAYWALAHLLVAYPLFRIDFAILTAAGLVLGVLMWPFGPWYIGPAPYILEITRTALAACVGVHLIRWARRRFGNARQSVTGQVSPKK